MIGAARPRRWLLAWPVLSALLTFVPATAGGNQRSCGPPLQQVLAASMTRAALDPRQPVSWRRRLAWSALLPRVSGRFGQSREAGEMIDLRSGGNAVDLNNYLALRWEIRATWDLSRLLFDQRELQVAARQREIAAQRQVLLEQVARLYFERCRLLVRGTRKTAVRPSGVGAASVGDGSELGDREKDLRDALELQHLTALLDGLSGGLFSGARWP